MQRYLLKRAYVFWPTADISLQAFWISIWITTIACLLDYSKLLTTLTPLNTPVTLLRVISPYKHRIGDFPLLWAGPCFQSIPENNSSFLLQRIWLGRFLSCFVFKVDVGKLFHSEYNSKIPNSSHCSHYWQLFHQMFILDKDISSDSWTIHFYPLNHSNRLTSYWFPAMFSSHFSHFFLLSSSPSCLKTWHSWPPHLKGTNLKKLQITSIPAEM